jgi:hypothetical protein
MLSGVPISKSQKERLSAAGFSAKDLRDLSAALDADDDDEPDDDEPDDDEPGRRAKAKSKPAKRNGSGRVVMLEGEDAAGFIERYFGESADADDDDTDDDDTDTDDKPRNGPGYFK